MRLFKFVLTACFAALAVLVGLFIAAGAAITSAVLFFFGRLRADRNSGRNVPLFRRAEARSPKSGHPDAIDVIATEVPADGPSR